VLAFRSRLNAPDGAAETPVFVHYAPPSRCVHSAFALKQLRCAERTH